MIRLGQVDPKQADHIQEHHHFSVKAAEYDVWLVRSLLSDFKKAKGYLHISGSLIVASQTLHGPIN
jgi:hypothetical protein